MHNSHTTSTQYCAVAEERMSYLSKYLYSPFTNTKTNWQNAFASFISTRKVGPSICFNTLSISLSLSLPISLCVCTVQSMCVSVLCILCSEPKDPCRCCWHHFTMPFAPLSVCVAYVLQNERIVSCPFGPTDGPEQKRFVCKTSHFTQRQLQNFRIELQFYH